MNEDDKAPKYSSVKGVGTLKEVAQHIYAQLG